MCNIASSYVVTSGIVAYVTTGRLPRYPFYKDLRFTLAVIAGFRWDIRRLDWNDL